jgi:hypothetical protein
MFPDPETVKSALDAWRDPLAHPLEDVDGMVAVLEAARGFLVLHQAISKAPTVWVCVERRTNGELSVSNGPGGPNHCYFRSKATHLPDCGWKVLAAVASVLLASNDPMDEHTQLWADQIRNGE